MTHSERRALRSVPELTDDADSEPDMLIKLYAGAWPTSDKCTRPKDSPYRGMCRCVDCVAEAKKEGWLWLPAKGHYIKTQENQL